MANPNAMLTAAAAWQSLNAIGMPEARLPIAQAIITVCESPKSNSVVTAIERAWADAEKGEYENVPLHLRDTHYKGADKLGSGEGYLYPHDFPGHYIHQKYTPVEAEGLPYYEPSDQGYENDIRRLRLTREENARLSDEIFRVNSKGARNDQNEDQ
jgi:putative ATPase